MAEKFFGVISPSDFTTLADFITQQDVRNCPVVNEILRYLKKHGSNQKIVASGYQEFMKGGPFEGGSDNLSVLSGFSFNFSGVGIGKGGWDEDQFFDF